MYNESGLQLNRGTFNSQMSGNVTGTVMHSYKNMLDTIATISAPGYFPNNFNADPTEIFVGDALQIVGSDGLEIFEITSLSPVTVVANSGNFPGGITTTTINATTSITSPIITATTSITSPLYLGGDMTLTGDITATNITATNQVLADLIRTTPVTGVIVSPNITATDIGTNILIATNYIQSLGYMDALGNITSDTGNIAATTGNVTAGGSMTAAGNITSTGGFISGAVSSSSITVGGGSTPITFFDEWSATVALTGPFTFPTNTFMKIQRINQDLYYYIRGVPGAAASVSDAIFIADGTIPAAFRPAILREVGPFTTINNSVYQVSSVACRSLGGIIISGSLQNSTPFTGSGNCGFMDIQFLISQN